MSSVAASSHFSPSSTYPQNTALLADQPPWARSFSARLPFLRPVVTTPRRPERPVMRVRGEPGGAQVSPLVHGQKGGPAGCGAGGDLGLLPGEPAADRAGVGLSIERLLQDFRRR